MFEFDLLPRSTSKGFSTSRPVEVLRATTDSLALSLVPQLIGLTDAFGFDDWDLDSALGKSDGRVYEDLLRRAREEAGYNVGTEDEKQELYRTAIKPILDRGRRLSARSKL